MASATSVLQRYLRPISRVIAETRQPRRPHLAGARSAAKILDARDKAAVAYDMAKLAGRLAAARGAYDDLIPRIHRAQADALVNDKKVCCNSNGWTVCGWSCDCGPLK